MFTICARIDSKKSDGNFGSNAVGIIVTEENLELKNPDEIAAKADELFRVAGWAGDLSPQWNRSEHLNGCRGP